MRTARRGRWVSLMPPHESGSRVTTVQRFTATGPRADAAPGLRAYARHRAGLKGFDSGITLRLTGRSGDHVRLEQWSGMHALLRATHDESFLPHLAAATAGAEVRHELAVSVGRMPAAIPLAGAARVVLVRAVVESEPARLEMDFG